MEDLISHHEVTRTADENTTTMVYDFVPPEVMGTRDSTPEPQWSTLPRMEFFDFYHGLQQRNWTSKYYQPTAEKWDLVFFQDSGRMFTGNFPGFRCLGTKADGSQFWVDIPYAGAPMFMKDYVSAGTKGALLTPKAEPLMLNLNNYGYNQVLAEVFAAYEQKVPLKVRQALATNRYLADDMFDSLRYNCPADKHLAVHFTHTPPVFSVPAFLNEAPTYIAYGFCLSFLAVCITIGIFRPQKQMPSDYLQAQEFAQSKGKARKEGMTNVRFSDVAGIDTVREELMEIVQFLKNAEDPQRLKLGLKPPKGVLLEGDPGTGKTLIAKAIAGEAGVPFYQMTGSEFVEIIVGVGAARVRDLFKRARVNAPCIIFVDEIDALGIRRADAGIRTNEEREQTLNQLLTEIDGFEVDLGNPVVFMAATNRADLLDPALLRAGRFDRKIRVQRPDTEGRFAILKVHARSRAKRMELEDDDLMQLAKDLPGLSGAELENIINEAALEGIRRGTMRIGREEVYAAVDRVLQGLRRPPLNPEYDVSKRVAAYEAGRGLVAYVLGKQSGQLEKVERISIERRGEQLSRTTFVRSDADFTLNTRGRVMDKMTVQLAGRVAEQMVFGTGSTYGSDDLKDAYNLADKLVTTYGVSDIGIVSYAPSSLEPGANRVAYGVGLYDADDELFGRNTPALLMHPSDELHNRFKRATLRLVLQAYRDALELVHSQREAHAALVSMLLEQKVVMGSELASLVEQYPAVGEVPSMPDDVVRQLVRVVGGWGGAKTPMPTQEAAFEVAKH